MQLSMAPSSPPIPSISSIPLSLSTGSQVPNLLRKEAKIGDDIKGNVYGPSISPPASYAKQFKQDFKLFLRSRSKELVPQSGMLLTLLGRYDTPEYISIPGTIRMALNDLASENLIEAAKLEHFNVPLYFATVDEVREIIFSVERLEIIKLSWDGSSLDEEGRKGFKDDNERAEFITRNKRSILEPLLKAHFGRGILDELFARLKNRIIQFLPKLEDPILVISLTQNCLSERELLAHEIATEETTQVFPFHSISMVSKS